MANTMHNHIKANNSHRRIQCTHSQWRVESFYISLIFIFRSCRQRGQQSQSQLITRVKSHNAEDPSCVLFCLHLYHRGASALLALCADTGIDFHVMSRPRVSVALQLADSQWYMSAIVCRQQAKPFPAFLQPSMCFCTFNY